MKTFSKYVYYFLIIIFITCNLGYAQNNDLSPSVDKIIEQLEKSFKMRSLQIVEPYLSEEFTINEFDPLFSKLTLGVMVIGFPLKKIKNVEIIDQNNDRLQLKCDLVIDKFFGLFSESVELIILSDNEKTYLKQLILDRDDVAVSVELDTDSSEGQKEINLNDYPKVVNKTIPTYYEEGLGDIAKEINTKQIEEIKIAERILGEELLFKIGLLLLNDSFMNASINRPAVPVTLLDTKMSEISIYWSYPHELVELHLTLGMGITDPNTRWFRDGLADYVAQRVARETNPQTHSVFMKERMESYDDIGRDANLLEWIGTGKKSKKQSGIEGGPGQYAAAMLFFIDLTEKHGEEIIPKLMSVLKDHRDVTSKILIKEMSAITGENIKELLKEY